MADVVINLDVVQYKNEINLTPKLLDNVSLEFQSTTLDNDVNLVFSTNDAITLTPIVTGDVELTLYPLYTEDPVELAISNPLSTVGLDITTTADIDLSISPSKGETGVKGDPGVGVPVGGDPQQVLAKNSATDFDTAWVDAVTEGMPGGGTTGQVLAKKSDTDYDTEWVNQTGGTGTGNSYFPSGW